MYNEYFLECDIGVTTTWQSYANKIVDTYKKDCEITESKPVPILKIEEHPKILEPLENYKKYLSGHFRILIIKPGEHVHHHLDVNVQGQYSLIPKGTQITAVLNTEQVIVILYGNSLIVKLPIQGFFILILKKQKV
jgi:hypothetical protein